MPTPWKQALGLAAITLAVFWPTLSAQFVYDARLQIVTGDFIHDPGNWLPVLSFGVLGMDVLDFNRPAHLASLMTDAAVWGREPFGYHLTSVLLHALNVVMVWGIVREARQPGRLPHELAALLFAVHPIVTEAVCEPTFREDLLVAACTLGALLLAMHHNPAVRGGDRWRALACAGLCFLAVASKESGIAAPAVLAVSWWLFRRDEPRAFWQLAVGGGAAAAAVFAIRTDLRMALALALIVLPLVPVSNLFPIYRAAADRYMYIPMAGVALAAGWLLDGPWLAARPRLREKATIAAIAAVVILGLACVERQKVWAKPLALWEDTFLKNPTAYTAASGLGESLREVGRLQEAERAAREAIRLSDGKRGDSWAALALILDAQGREAEAFEAADKALEVQPSLADPAARVRVLAMERHVAQEWRRLLARRP